jgi:hypothetical protein
MGFDDMLINKTKIKLKKEKRNYLRTTQLHTQQHCHLICQTLVGGPGEDGKGGVIRGRDVEVLRDLV